MADNASTSRKPTDMDIDHDPVRQIEKLEKFSKEAARAFFKEFGLISHQIRSYNNFVEHSIQDLFDSLGEFSVDDPLKKGDLAGKHVAISLGQVRLKRPTFSKKKGDNTENEIDKVMTPRHARLQNMTYSAPLYVEVKVQVGGKEN